jgi:uncharacterized membrane-anchored protein
VEEIDASRPRGRPPTKKECDMSKRITIYFLATAAAAALLAVMSSMAAASSTSASVTASKPRVVPIVMADPGCHWFQVAGKNKKKLVVNGKTTLRNLDEAALIFKGKKYHRRLAVGKTLTIAKAGVYHITMVKQAPDDNHLLLVVR